MKRVIPYLGLFIFISIACIFFYQFFLNGKIPIAADTIVGLYHPFRDYYVSEYPNGIPFKNFLITDPVRQLYPWRTLAVESVKHMQLPLWNPYSGAGTPLMGNFQSAVFYPLNILFFILPFDISWTILIILQVVLSGYFMYLFLKNHRLTDASCVLGGVVFSLCGFNIAWLTWNTVVHVLLWLPLILLGIDKLLFTMSRRWFIILLFALVSSFFAGHLQTFFYVVLVSTLYFFSRLFQIFRSLDYSNKAFHLVMKRGIVFFILVLSGVVITSIQWLPTFIYLSQSARAVDQSNWKIEGWFVPWQHLAQFIAPDFFGNPSTLNYWGVWNYGELIGYIGIFPLIIAVFALLFRRDLKTAFFGTVFFLSLSFSLPTLLAKIPYLLALPFISSSQPTRLLSITDFSLAVIAALGLDMFIRGKRGVLYSLFIFACIFIFLWGVVLMFFPYFGMTIDQAEVAKNNIKLATILFAVVFSLVSLTIFIKKQSMRKVIVWILVLVAVLDLLRFGWKFTPFTQEKYLYPHTRSLTFIESDKSIFRVMTTDNRILPPNFSVMYGIQSIDLYDPLYLKRYGELVTAMERDEPNISPPFGFNRIITPRGVNSPIINLLNVKYILSFTDLSSERFKKVYTEGSTMIFENNDVLPRAFFVKKVIAAGSNTDAIKKVFLYKDELGDIGVVQERDMNMQYFSQGSVTIESYSPGRIVLHTKNTGEGFLVVSDVYFPSWNASLITKTGKQEIPIYRTNYAFRGINVPRGAQTVIFSQSVL
ncbi:MAG: hypothetical protein RLZZ455_476 [Candidatus Parcubacteria bacterium]|jgi:hypothetical protein